VSADLASDQVLAVRHGAGPARVIAPAEQHLRSRVRRVEQRGP